MRTLIELGQYAKEASFKVAKLSIDEKNKALYLVADALEERANDIIEANKIDMANGKSNGMAEGLLDRLMLNEVRIKGMADGIRDVAKLPDPVGEVLGMEKRPNGLMIGRKRVPMGVIGIIYEARPNVTSDAFALCFKAGNASILRSGKDAICSAKAIIDVIKNTLSSMGLEEAVQLIEDTSHETADEFMRLNEYIDVLIPRGSNRLIQAVVKNATVPVIETGTGNCHIYVDEYADLNKAVPIIINAKTQRIGVCNACESLVIHENILDKAMPLIAKALTEKDVEIRCDDKSKNCAGVSVEDATEEDYSTEYLALKISVKTVSSIDEAIAHINKNNTGHSEAIITENYENAQRFLDEIDAAAVYVNASTRFTDGGEFGFGAEIGISTQKLHARGPMGLKELTTYKYIIYGNGQVRP